MICAQYYEHEKLIIIEKKKLRNGARWKEQAHASVELHTNSQLPVALCRLTLSTDVI
jgi:hypothetical protein